MNAITQPATLASRKPSRAKLPLHLPRVYCGRCKRQCPPTCVVATGNATRSRVVYACSHGRCQQRGNIVHRTPTFANPTGY